MDIKFMKPLRRSVQSSIHNLEPPKSDSEFEDLCLDIFKLILKGGGIKLYNKVTPGYVTYKGTKGDKQYGIDIKCQTSLAVAQCKLVKDLFPNDLDKELVKLIKYKGEVSHYFFLISNDRVKSSLQDWVDERNRETEEKASKDKRFPVKPAERLPWFNIMGWSEIKNYLLENTLLSLKWGALQGVANKYYYLPGLKIEKLEGAITNLQVGTQGEPCTASVFGGRSLTDQLNLAEISRMGLESKILTCTLGEISRFIKLYDESLCVARTYRNTLQKLESEDLIVFEEGLGQLNNLAFHSARIYALQYLKEAYRAAHTLADLLWFDENCSSEETEVEDYGYGCADIPTGFMLFNFTHPDEVHPPWFVNPQSVQESASILVEAINKFRSMAAG